MKQFEPSAPPLYDDNLPSYNEAIKLYDFNIEISNQSFIENIIADNLENVSYLIHHGIDINQRQQNNSTPLMIALMRLSPNCAKLIIEQGADINATNDYNETALLFAIDERLPSNIITLLIDKGANINCFTKISDRCSQTPLMRAILCNNFDIVKLLIQKGADVNTKSDNNITPLDWAKSVKLPYIIEFLQKNGAL
jgi:ankyrin repeat protein